jgi:CRP-like cAMP-binding protein
MPLAGYGKGFYHRLGLSDWAGLWPVAEPGYFAAGETLIEPARPARRVVFIEHGLVRVTAHVRGQAAFLRMCGPGQVLGEDLLLTGQRESRRRRGIAAVALTECTTLAVTREDLLAYLRQRPHLWPDLVDDLVERTTGDEELIVRLACDSVDMRLAWLLVDLVRHGGGVADDGARLLPVELSEASMALWIGASRRAVDRALAKWRARGAVTRRDGKLVIRDLAFLARVAQMPQVPAAPAARLAGHPAVRLRVSPAAAG